jgi:dipeptidase E
VPEPQIVAIGGGGFDARDTALRAFVLGLTGKADPRVLLLPTASGDSDATVARFYEAFTLLRCRPAHARLFGIPTPGVHDLLLAQDAIFVAGGNTANMLAVWRVHGVDETVREAWRRGVVLTGMSAGSICWFEHGVTDSFRAELDAIECLGFLPGSNCPHYDGEEQRRPAYHRFVADGLPAGIAADDGCALHFRGTELVEVVASRPGAQAHRVEASDGAVHETPLGARLLDPGHL